MSDENVRDPAERLGLDQPAAGPAASEKERFVNFRVSHDEFVEIKTAALREGLTLGQYVKLVHGAYHSRAATK
jgi:predicted DNA binding CopG/RHH family protein